MFKEHDNLIIGNLHCNRGNYEDDKYYRKLGKIIKERKIGFEQTTFNWLVAYAHDDPQSFPTYFIKPFGEPILLDGELKESMKISRKIALKHIGKEPKAEAEQQESKTERKKMKGIVPFQHCCCEAIPK